MKQALPENINGQRLCRIFNYRWKWISASLEDSSLNTNWKTNDRYPLKARILWMKHQDANQLIGVRFGNSTSYAMLDIDKDSPYIEAIDTVRGALETVGIVRSVPIRSSWSGGIHLYIPLPQSFPTFGVACLLQACLEAQGLHIAPGQLECFPNVKAYGKSWLGEFTEYNGHRLPLQPGTGSCILDDNLEPIPAGYDLSRFFALWDNAVLLNDRDEIAEAICIAKANRRHRKRQASGPAAQWKADLEAIIAEGWTGHGQTNDLLKQIGTYGRVFEKLGGSALADYILHVATNRPGFERWCQHQHELTRRCQQWAAAVEKFYWPLGDEPLRERTFVAVNALRAADARDRIATAAREIRFEVGLTISQMVKRLVELAKCSIATLYKNRDLWHPEQPVIDDTAGDTADLAAVHAAVRASLESVGTWAFTGNGGENEACIDETPDLKNLKPQGRDGGAGEGKGFSTGWLPDLNWYQPAPGHE